MGIVNFEATLKPSATMRERTHLERPGPDGRPELARAGGAALMVRIMVMPHEERVAVVVQGAGDPLLVLFAMLTPGERRQIIEAAEDFLKAKVTE